MNKGSIMCVMYGRGQNICVNMRNAIIRKGAPTLERVAVAFFMAA